MSDVPFARACLIDLAHDLRESGDETVAERIIDIVVDYMVREKKKRRAPTQSQKITPEMVAAILEYEEENPDLTLQTIGERFGVSGGRVSEIINGKR